MTDEKKIVPLRKTINGILAEASEYLAARPSSRVLVIIDGDDEGTIFQQGFATDSEVKHLLHDWYENYLIGQIEFEVVG